MKRERTVLFMKNTLIKTERLSKSFSGGGVMQHVLKNIDLELNREISP